MCNYKFSKINQNYRRISGMKIVTTYTCDICGKSSTDRAEIERCEAKVRKPKFGPGHEFSFWASPRKDSFISKGIIEKFYLFEKGSHEPLYLATCTNRDGSLLKNHPVYESTAEKKDKE